MEWFIWLLFGHCFGDYVFQSYWLASNKKVEGWLGTKTCAIHCSIYTVCVGLFLTLGSFSVTFTHLMLIFISHWMLDRYHLLDWYMKTAGIRSWAIYLPTDQSGNIDVNANANTKMVISTSFGAFVYIVIDNTLHLFMMFLILKYL